MKKSEINNLLRGFGKIFTKKKNPNALKNILIEKLLKYDERVEIKEENYEGYLDDFNVLMVIPKIEIIKYLIEVNFEFERKDKEKVKDMMIYIKKEINMRKGKQNGEEISSLYNPKYLSIIFNLTKNYENNVRIKMHKDSPLFVETPDFTIILAPRIENEEKIK